MRSRVELPPSQEEDSLAKLSIASVTVAYNGAEVLRSHLESLKRQTRELDEIVVVDNASTDETAYLVAAEYPQVKLLQLPRNAGIAGGLAAALAYAALERKHDWVWTFDQDSVPAPDALERLLTGLERLNGAKETTAVLAPRCLNQTTGTTYPALSWHGWRFTADAGSPSQYSTFVDMVISSGCLIRREAIEAAGLPLEDLFMDFVDYEYCLRLRRQGFRIAQVHDSTLDHAIGTPKTFKILGRKKSWTDHAPWREYYMTRNEIFTIGEHRPGFAGQAFVLYRVLHHAFGILLLGKNKRECLRMIWRGYFDGKAGRLGIRFLPGREEEESKKP